MAVFSFPDRMLPDAARAQVVDIIDIRYWSYRTDGSLYAPPGGMQLAPRQHASNVNPGKRSFEQVYRAVSEYRKRYPEKAVIYSEGNYTDFGWAAFTAGGSLAPINVNLPGEFLKAAAEMHPVKGDDRQKNVDRLSSPLCILPRRRFKNFR
jgi:hypothetical protein